VSDIKVLSTHAVEEVLRELGPSFERASGARLVIDYDPANALKRKIADGVAFDAAKILPRKSARPILIPQVEFAGRAQDRVHHRARRRAWARAWSKRFVGKRLFALQEFLGSSVAIPAQIVGLRRFMLTFPRLVAVIPARSNALFRHRTISAFH